MCHYPVRPDNPGQGPGLRIASGMTRVETLCSALILLTDRALVNTMEERFRKQDLYGELELCKKGIEP
jgi:hypothetical protein